MKRFNWIDILVIVVLIGALAIGGYLLLSEDDTIVGSDGKLLTEPNLQMIVEVPDLSREIAENVIATFSLEPRELDGISVETTRLFNSNRLVDGQITSWEIRDTEDEAVVCLRLTIEANGTLFRGSYNVGTQEVRIGKTFIAKTMSVELDGIVASLTELKK